MDDHQKSTTPVLQSPNVTDFRPALSPSGAPSFELLGVLFIWAIPIAFLLLAAAGALWVLFFKKKIDKKMASPIKKVPTTKFHPPEAFGQKYTDGNFSLFVVFLPDTEFYKKKKEEEEKK